MNEQQKSLDYYQRAVQLRRSLGDRAGEARILSNIGALYTSLGKTREALDYYYQALTLVRGEEDRRSEAIALANIGSALDSLGEKREALNFYERALVLLRQAGDKQGEAFVLNSLGVIYRQSGERQRSVETLKQAIGLARGQGDRFQEASILNNLGKTYDDLGEPEESAAYFNQALALRRELNDYAGVAATLISLSYVNLSQGKTQAAVSLLTEANGISRRIGDPRTEAHTLNGIGEVYNSLGEWRSALQLFEETLALHRRAGNISGEATALGNIGLASESMGDRQKALEFYGHAIAALERVRVESAFEETESGPTQQLLPVYQRMIRLLMRMGEQGKAFDLSERARARTFLSQLGEGRRKPLSKEGEELSRREQTLLSEIESLERRIASANTTPDPAATPEKSLAVLRAELADKRLQHESALTQLRLAEPGYVSTRSVNTLTLPQIQSMLDKNTSLLSYFVMPEEVIIFVVTKSSFHAVEAPVGKGEVEKIERNIREGVMSFRNFTNLRDLHPPAMRNLYSLLITPVKPYLKTPSVGIIPHGVLHYLPFAALSDGRRYLLDDYALFYLPSASTFPIIRQRKKPTRNQVLAVAPDRVSGFPSMPYSVEEVYAISRLFNTAALTGQEATESAFKRSAGDFEIIHLATYCLLDTQEPLKTRLLLSPDNASDGMLELQEVYGLDLSKTDLVVLSGSETQLGKVTRGDDVISMSRAFMHAGASTVVASLWNVEDKSTAALMGAFYKHLRAGRSKAEALRAAELEIRRRFPHPYYWAAFVLTGEPGDTTVSGLPLRP